VVSLEDIHDEADDGNGRGPWTVTLGVSITEGPFVDGVACGLPARVARRVIAAFGADVLNVRHADSPPAAPVLDAAPPSDASTAADAREPVQALVAAVRVNVAKAKGQRS